MHVKKTVGKCIAGKGGANDLRHGIQWQNMMYSLPPPGQGNGQPDQGVRNDNGPAVYRQGFKKCVLRPWLLSSGMEGRQIRT